MAHVQWLQEQPEAGDTAVQAAVKKTEAEWQSKWDSQLQAAVKKTEAEWQSKWDSQLHIQLQQGQDCLCGNES